MHGAGHEPGADDPALAWREELSLRLTRAFCVALFASAVLMVLVMDAGAVRTRLCAVVLVAAATVAIPAVTGRPRGNARAWFIVGPALLTSFCGFAFVGMLSGPGVTLAVTLMLAGLLLGRRAMILLTGASALVVSAIGFAMVTARIPAPSPADIAMASAVTWARSVGVTFLAISLFGGMVVALVARMEQTLRLAKQETLRRERAERERAEAQLMAVEGKQLETIGRLAAGIAHDFNNNLTAIMGSAELLKLDLPQTGSATELSDSILQASQRLAELTRQLLAYSRKARMVQTPTDVHTVIGEAVSLLRRSMDPNIHVITELTAPVSTVLADAALLQSAVLNLLLNARDAMPDGGKLTVATSLIELTHSSSRGLPLGPCLVVEVIDTGRGIPREQLAHIFDPFFTTKPIGKGTGLGLASVAGTVKAHGGSIDVNSDAGGTVFRVYLPCADVESGATPMASRVVPGHGEILLVEDDAMVSMTAIATLRSFGYEVTHAADGARAIEQVLAHPGRFGLALLDLRMPGMSGEATFERLQELEPGLPVLLWSGYGAEQDVSAMLKKGAVGFVQKPYRVAELSRTVAECMRDARLDQRAG